MSTSDEATQLLQRVQEGEQAAMERLLPLVYTELRSLAALHFRRERANHTLQPTALVHEAFVRLINQTGAKWSDRTHFLAVAAMAMRHILTDYSRRRAAAKRGGGVERVPLETVSLPGESDQINLVALDEALVELAELDQRRHRIVELRFFGGLSMEEIARLLEMSITSVEGEWRGARAWLAARLGA